MALYAYLPKYCIRVCQNVAFLFTKNIALLLTGYINMLGEQQAWKLNRFIFKFA